MLNNIRLYLQKTRNKENAAYFWNAAGSIMAALQSIIILAVVTRTNGVYDAGVFSIGYAVGNLMMYIGNFGVRKYQATDINEEYVFEDYHGMRIITCSAMLFGSLVYCIYGALFNHYGAEKFLVILFICVFKCIQAYSDVFHGRLQQKNRLDIGAKAATIRFVLSLLACIALLCFFHNLLVAITGYMVVFFIITVLTSINVAVQYCSLRPRFRFVKIKNLTIICFPLFVCVFLSNYIANAPKYAIEAYLNEEVQAYFGYIFMPAFAINMVTMFLFNPMLTEYAYIFEKKDLDLFRKKIYKMIMSIAMITIIGLLAAYIGGTLVLSLIFGINLSGYEKELCVVVIGGGMLAYATFFTNVITVIRLQRTLVIGYIIASLIALIFSKYFVVCFNIMGAVCLYAVVMSVLAIYLFIVVVTQIIK